VSLLSLPVINWCINPIVLRVDWWFDGKHFSSLLQQLLEASQTGNAIGLDSCCARRRLTQFSWWSR